MRNCRDIFLLNTDFTDKSTQKSVGICEICVLFFPILLRFLFPMVFVIISFSKFQPLAGEYSFHTKSFEGVIRSTILLEIFSLHLFSFHHIFSAWQSPAIHQSVNVRVHRKCRNAKSLWHHNACRFMANGWKRFKASKLWGTSPLYLSIKICESP